MAHSHSYQAQRTKRQAQRTKRSSAILLTYVHSNAHNYINIMIPYACSIFGYLLVNVCMVGTSIVVWHDGMNHPYDTPHVYLSYLHTLSACWSKCKHLFVISSLSLKLVFLLNYLEHRSKIPPDPTYIQTTADMPKTASVQMHLLNRFNNIWAIKPAGKSVDSPSYLTNAHITGNFIPDCIYTIRHNRQTKSFPNSNPKRVKPSSMI